MSIRPPLANTVKIQVLWLGPNSTRAANILYALMGSGWSPTSANLRSVAINFGTAWTLSTSWLPLQSNQWALESVTCYDNGGSTENIGNYAIGSAGSATGNPLPPNIAAVVSWAIPAHYRGGHPRTYIPGIPESALATVGGNWWSNTWRNTMAAAGTAFLNSFLAGVVSGAAEQLGTIAFKRNGVPLTTPVFYPYSGGQFHQRVDSQRRRLGKENVLA